MELDVGLKEFRSRNDGGVSQRDQPRGLQGRPLVGRGLGRATLPTGVRDVVPVQRPFCYYRCDQEGHRALDCPVPPLREPPAQTPRSSGRTRGWGQGIPEQSRIATQSSGSEYGVRDESDYYPGMACRPEESGSAEEEAAQQDPMVGAPISPFVIQVTLCNPRTGQIGHQGALLDTGCTQCLLRKALAVEMGL